MAERAWDAEYATTGHIWGDEPTPLGVFAAEYLAARAPEPRILDVGCGYGRDALFLAETLRCEVVGIDASVAAIADAEEAAGDLGYGSARFEAGDFGELAEGGFDAVFAANLYQVLRAGDRARFRELLPRWLTPGGMVLLSTLSVSDPQEYGKGEPVPGDEDSFDGAKFLHFSSRGELVRDFSAFELGVLRELEFEEPRAEGEPHHHVCWLLAGRLA